MRRALLVPLLGLLVLVLAADCNDLRIPVRRSDSAASTPAQPAPPAPNPAPARLRPGRAGTTIDVARFEQIRRGLRRLVVAEENYYAENGVYTENLPQIGFRPEGDSQIRFLWLSRAGWAARSTHPGLAGLDCVIYVGREHSPATTSRQARSAKEGVPACDEPPPPRAAPAAGASGHVAAARVAADTGSALDDVEPSVQMKVDLRNLARSQESYLGNQGVYSRRMEPFALQFLWRRGVGITILGADDASWSAMATHATRPGKSCVIWVGPVSRKPATLGLKQVPDEPGTPICDD